MEKFIESMSASFEKGYRTEIISIGKEEVDGGAESDVTTEDEVSPLDAKMNGKSRGNSEFLLFLSSLISLLSPQAHGQMINSLFTVLDRREYPPTQKRSQLSPVESEMSTISFKRESTVRPSPAHLRSAATSTSENKTTVNDAELASCHAHYKRLCKPCLHASLPQNGRITVDESKKR
jgi:hypothetical protein